MNSTYQINGKICLVTGANRGIGKAIATGFLKAGASKVYAGVRDLESVSPLLETYGSKLCPLIIDLADEATICNAVESTKDVEVVVNNAGVLKGGSPLDNKAIAALQYEMEVNAFGLLRMANAYAPILKANGGGVFIQLNSVASLRSFPELATYCASKAASYSLTLALHSVLREQGTQVLSVHPGPIKTDMAVAAGLGDMGESPEVVVDALLKALSNGEFHCFPDAVAREIGAAYKSFSENVIEASQH